MDLDEVALTHQLAGPVAIGLERRNEGGEYHHPGIDKQLGHLANTADIFHSIGVGKAQVLT